ncbi:hypothetical protein RCL1_003115 [Eukaryota sp. TZLM3-RCL]
MLISPEIIEAAFTSRVHAQLVDQHTRRDGRDFLERRSLSSSPNCFSHCDGSCLVRLGTTVVSAAIMVTISPKSITPDNLITVSVSVPCYLNSTDFSSTQNLLNSLLLKNPPFSLSELSSSIPETSFVFQVDVTILDNSGSELDACLIAISTAFSNLKLPVFEGEEYKKVFGTQSLTITRPLLSGSFAVINGKLVFDPTSTESKIADSVISIVISCHAQISELSDDVITRVTQLPVVYSLSSGAPLPYSLYTRALLHLRETI